MHQEIVDSLQTTALEIDCAETYAQAISLYARFHYVLVILNLGIPDADGVAIVRRLRQLEQTPILQRYYDEIRAEFEREDDRAS